MPAPTSSGGWSPPSPRQPTGPVWGPPPTPPPTQPGWRATSTAPGYPPGPPHDPAIASGASGPGDSPSRDAGRGLKVGLAIVSAFCVLFGGIAIGALASRPSTVATTNNGPVTSAVNPSGSASGGTVPGDSIEPASAVAIALKPAVVQLQTDEGLGSGVVYDASGLILTNAHVVGTAKTLEVQFDNGRTASGSVLGSDPEADIAVVKIDAQDITAARLEDGKVVVGQMAIAIGSPFGLSESVTAGIVSAVDRPVDGNADVTINMIQTDAPINPGNSGGALANRYGAVIGINTSIFSQTGDNSGIGFAIPIQTAKAVADKIVAGLPLDHGYLGVSSVAPDDGSSGAQIAAVTAGSPAEQSGIHEGDIVESVDGNPVRTPQELSARIVAKSPGETVALVIRRDGQSLTISATLGARPPSSTRRTTTTR
jgi:putative serine protease PepD